MDYLPQLEDLVVELSDTRDVVYHTEMMLEAFADRGLDELVALKSKIETITSQLQQIQFMKKMQSTIEARRRKYQALIRSIPNATAVALHDCDEKSEFRYLDIFAPIPERLNKSREVMLGSSAWVVDSDLAQARVHYIRKCLATAQVENYKYTHHWNGRDWHFKARIVPLYGSEEVISIVEDAYPFQREWWLNKYEPNSEPRTEPNSEPRTEPNSEPLPNPALKTPIKQVRTG